jgi:hypothetical protein
MIFGLTMALASALGTNVAFLFKHRGAVLAPPIRVRHGEKIGKLQDVYVYVDVETDEPQFGTVKEGLIGRHLTFVPLGGTKVGPDDLRVAVSRQQVKDAHNIEQHGEELSQADESALYHHYELNYTPPNTQSGRRLARR